MIPSASGYGSSCAESSQASPRREAQGGNDAHQRREILRAAPMQMSCCAVVSPPVLHTGLWWPPNALARRDALPTQHSAGRRIDGGAEGIEGNAEWETPRRARPCNASFVKACDGIQIISPDATLLPTQHGWMGGMMTDGWWCRRNVPGGGGSGLSPHALPPSNAGAGAVPDCTGRTRQCSRSPSTISLATKARWPAAPTTAAHSRVG
jgi:hypothetical protein